MRDCNHPGNEVPGAYYYYYEMEIIRERVLPAHPLDVTDMDVTKLTAIF